VVVDVTSMVELWVEVIISVSVVDAVKVVVPPSASITVVVVVPEPVISNSNVVVVCKVVLK